MCEWDELEKNQSIYPIKTFGKGGSKVSKICFDLTWQKKCVSLYFIVILEVRQGTRLLHLLCTLLFRKSSLWQRLWPITESQWVHHFLGHSSLSKRLSPGRLYLGEWGLNSDSLSASMKHVLVLAVVWWEGLRTLRGELQKKSCLFSN